MRLRSERYYKCCMSGAEAACFHGDHSLLVGGNVALEETHKLLLLFFFVSVLIISSSSPSSCSVSLGMMVLTLVPPSLSP